MKYFYIIVVLLCLFGGHVLSQTPVAPSSGDGSSLSPYQIHSVDHLYWIASDPLRWDKAYLQVANIDASQTSSWDDGDGGDPEGFIPIGNETTPFTGTYEGNGYSISGLFIQRAASDYVGMFGLVEQPGTIRNLTLMDADVTGDFYTGALVGSMGTNSTIENSSSSGSVGGYARVGGLVGEGMGSLNHCESSVMVSSVGSNCGGLVGYASGAQISQSFTTGSINCGENNAGGLIGLSTNETHVENCFSRASVQGQDEDIGGLVGDLNSSSSVSFSYSTGDVSSNTSSMYVGGLVGYSSASDVSDSFWDYEAAGESSGEDGTPKMTSEMKNVDTFTDASNSEGLANAWDFLGDPNDDTSPEDVWDIGAQTNDGYPFLNVPADDVPAGDGSEADPYVVVSFEHLKWISDNPDSWNSYFVQTANIDASESANIDDGDGGEAEGFSPIGIFSSPFSGTYEGNGFLIEGLVINRPNTEDVGLFGYTSSCTIRDLILKNVDISGKDDVGALLGESTESTDLNRCGSSGLLSGRNRVGGLVGSNYADISQCFSQAHLTTTGNNAGGLVGYQGGGNLYNSYSNGDVEASGNNIGGLVGLQDSDGIVNSCYSSAGVVTSTSGYDVGGLIGDNTSGQVSSCFWDSQVLDVTGSDGGTQKTTAEMTDIATYTDENTTGLMAAWDFIGTTNDDQSPSDFWEIHSVVNNGYPVLDWQYLTLSYQSEVGGSIDGTAIQYVKRGNDGTFVEAIPGDGYNFVEWNDGQTENPRKDLTVMADLDVTATFELATDIAFIQSKQRVVFPNPVQDEIHVRKPYQGSTYQLMSISGKVEMSGLIREGSINVSHLESGMYLLKVGDHVMKIFVK